MEPPIETPRPFALPTTAAEAAGDQGIQGEMRVIGPCLTILVVRNNAAGPTILPIWPTDFRAEATGDYMRLIGPLSVPTNDAVGAERLELRGELIDQPPADAVVPPDCADYQLFLVGRASNIAK